MDHFAFLDKFLDVHRILFELSDKAKLALAKIETFPSIGSTSTYLMEQVKLNPLSGQVCFAEEQTQGRGQQGRAWFSPPSGNIYCSLSWNFEAQDVANLSLAIGVILLDVFKKYGIDKKIELKWPNDVIFSGKKIAGVLLERSGKTVVIGMGINLKLPEYHDLALLKQAGDLAMLTEEPLDRNRLAGLLLNELLLQLPVFAAEGLAPFLKKWRMHDVLFGKMVRVTLLEKISEGKMVGISDQGELLLEDEAGLVEKFRCGEATLST